MNTKMDHTRRCRSGLVEPTVVLYLVILSLLVVSSSAFFLNDRRSSAYGYGYLSSSFPKLIRELNLFPEQEVSVPVDGHEPPLLTRTGKRIVDKRFKFPDLVVESGGGFSVEELGHHAGYYKLANTHNARMFYFFFESRNSKNDPVVLWLNGGPGCGSELALFYENGPFKIADNMSLLWNEYGWDQASNILYVDQPIGTGFSYSSDMRDIRYNENGVRNDLYDFLQAFFEEHPQFAKNDFYITGESFAGHYIPALASKVHQANKAKAGIHINLKGFAIGNGLTDPAIQYKSDPDYALDLGIISKSEYDRIKMIFPLCERTTKLCGTDGTVSCVLSAIVCSSIANRIVAMAGDINPYDIRRKCEGSSITCYDFSNVEKFLNQKPVKDAIGVGDIDFVLINRVVNLVMLADTMRNLDVGIPQLLEDGVEVLVYAGEYDLVCNWLGNSRWVHKMEWSGQKDFAASPEVPFVVNGSDAGVLKTYGPLSLLKVHDAGHMVPMDQPKASLEMLKRWMEGKLSEVPAGSENLVAEI